MLLTARDRELLEFAAEHRVVLAAHVQALTGGSAAAVTRRLGALVRARALARHRIFHGRPPCFQVTASGLALIASDLPRPKLDPRFLEHDVGVAWLWLAARRGTFGRVEQVISERRMRSHDGAATREQLFGVRLGGIGPRGGARVHYPDLLLIGGGGRVAIELELSSKGRTRRERILGGYGADPSVAAVLYLTPNPTIARSVSRTAARLGIAPLVHVQRLRVAPARGLRSGPGAERSAARAEPAR